MDHPAPPTAWQAAAWRAVGAVSVAIGIVNAFLPLLPTTVFLLIGAWAWGKGAPEWRARLLAHPRWGEPLRLWGDGRQMTRGGKRMATLGMASSWLLSAACIGLTTLVLTIGLGLATLAAWLWCRPEPTDLRRAHGPPIQVPLQPARSYDLTSAFLSVPSPTTKDLQ